MISDTRAFISAENDVLNILLDIIEMIWIAIASIDAVDVSL